MKGSNNVVRGGRCWAKYGGRVKRWRGGGRTRQDSLRSQAPRDWYKVAIIFFPCCNQSQPFLFSEAINLSEVNIVQREEPPRRRRTPGVERRNRYITAPTSFIRPSIRPSVQQTRQNSNYLPGIKWNKIALSGMPRRDQSYPCEGSCWELFARSFASSRLAQCYGAGSYCAYSVSAAE